MGILHRLYRAEIRCRRIVNGVRLEPGMQVEFQSPNFNNPLMTSEGRQAIEDAFMRRYGISIMQANAMSVVWIKCEEIN